MADINGLTITSTASEPKVVYSMSAEVSRVDNSKCKVTFNVDTYLTTSIAHLGKGFTLNIYFKVGNVEEKVFNVKHNDEVWRGAGLHSQKSFDYGEFPSTSAGGIDVWVRAVNIGGSAGTVGTELHHIVAPSLLPTPLGRPDNFRATSPVDGSDNAEGYAECEIGTWWDSAAAGINNPVSGYEIYAQVYDWVNNRWGAWKSIASGIPASQKSYTVKLPLVRGQESYLALEAKSALGYGYHSGWNVIIIHRNRLPTTPSSFAVKTDTSESSVFESAVTISWTESTDPDGNFARYRLEYATSTDGSTWSTYQFLTSQTGLSYAWTPAVDEGTYLKFRVRAEDALNAASGWRDSVVVRKEARSGLFVSIGGQVYPAKAYVSVGGQVYPGKPFASAGGQVYPGKL